MLVADNQERTTSATLGGGEAMDFGISDDPAFFHVLSSSLYNNPKLAVVRETICNQWDAHIEAGVTDKAVIIAIDKDGFISFRDFGNGIPNDKIKPVYGVYGASTKKSNSSVTGGFGLGCKSPFAYVDSFQVTSWNQGKMSIYNVAKSSVENNGKPGIIPILTNVPTEETGLEVKFQLKCEDQDEFIRYIQSIVFNGEIKAELHIEYSNGDWQKRELLVLGMPFTPGSYSIDNGWHQSYMGNHVVFVRYGNVMYPAVQSPETEEALGLIHNFMNIIGSNRIVVQAAPDSLAISPSRETLSNQKLTDDGITDLCVNLADVLEKDIKKLIPGAIKQIELGIKMVAGENYGLDAMQLISYHAGGKVAAYMRSSLWRNQRKHYYKHWFNLQLDAYFSQPAFDGIQFNNRVLRKIKANSNSYEFWEALNRYLILPFMLEQRKYKWAGYIIPSNYGGLHVWKESLQRYLRSTSNINILQMINCKRVVITRRMSDVGESYGLYPALSKLHSTKRGAFIVYVGGKKNAAEEASKKYSALGYEVVDLTQGHEWDTYSQQRKKESAYRAQIRAKEQADLLAVGMEGSTPNRLISIRCLLTKRQKLRDGKITGEYDYISSNCANPENWKKHNHIDVESPKYYVMQSEVKDGEPKDKYVMVSPMFRWEDLTEELLDTTIVCRNGTEKNKAIKRGAVHLDTVRCLQLVDVVKTKEFAKYATTERKSVLQELNMEHEDWRKLLDILKIKYKPFDKLVDKPEFDWAYTFLNEYSYTSRQRLVELGAMETVDSLAGYAQLTGSNNFKGKQDLYDLRAVFCSSLVSGCVYYSSAEQLYSWLVEHPEDIPGYKILIRNILTKRKGIYGK